MYAPHKHYKKGLTAALFGNNFICALQFCRKGFDFDLSKRLYKQITLLITFFSLLLFCILKADFALRAFNTVLGILTPLFIGAGFALCLVLPHRKIYAFMRRLFLKKLKEKHIYFISLCVTYLLFLLCCAAVFALILPEIGKSLRVFYSNLTLYGENISRFAKNLSREIPSPFSESLDLNAVFSSIMLKTQDLITGYFLNIFNITGSVIGFFSNLGLGLIISFYIMCDRRRLLRQIKTVIIAWLAPRRARRTIRIIQLSADTFLQFVSGQFSEMLILSLLCFIGMSIFGFHYPLLISIVIGVTNIIPIIGPIIGTVPCAFILFIEKPVSAVWFIIFIIVLQQVECSFIYPRVVGDKIGLPPLFVCLGVIVGGRLFGLFGALVALPAASVIYACLKQSTKRRMRRRVKSLTPKNA